jgi:hypothetical protein
MRRALAAAALVALVLGTSTALAAPARVVDRHPEDGDYAYDFFADNLQANAYGEGGGIIRVRDKVVRRTLIRPRTSFVSHLLKSVESI